MNNFLKDVRELAKCKECERVIASYEQGLITLTDAVTMMEGIKSVMAAEQEGANHDGSEIHS